MSHSLNWGFWKPRGWDCRARKNNFTIHTYYLKIRESLEKYLKMRRENTEIVKDKKEETDNQSKVRQVTFNIMVGPSVRPYVQT